MNSLWPAASRISCIQPRTIFLKCQKIDMLAVRLARESIKPYSIFSLPFRRRERELRIWNSSNSKIVKRTFATRRSGIITDWEDLPADYDDKEGLSFRENPFTIREAHDVFGKRIDANNANRLLRILHGRRVAGTLADPEKLSYLHPYEKYAQEVGLRWLRENVPVDETRNYGLRAEQELANMEDEIIRDSERIGLYKPNSKTPTPKSQKTKDRESLYGESGLDFIRKQKQREADEKDTAAAAARAAQAKEIQQVTGTLEPISANRRVELRRPGENPWLKKYIERSKVLPNTPPELTKFQRLWPSGLVVLSVVGLCLIFPSIYTPPKNSQRLWPDIPPAAATVIGLILANTVVLGLWRFPPAFRLLNKYFITVPGYPYPLSLIGNTFSHQSMSHWAVNMIVLFFVGSRLHDEVGRANFLAIYIACGALGSFASLTSCVLRNNFISSSLGASGSLTGIIAAYLWLNKDRPAQILGVFPPDGWCPPMWTALVLMGGMEVFALTKWNKTPVTLDHWAHLGGYAAGFGGAELLRSKHRRSRWEEMERRKNLGIIDKIKEGRV
jgi:rhomboid-like protein